MALREQELADYRQAERLRQIERIRQEEIRQKAIDDARRDNQRKSENVDHNK